MLVNLAVLGVVSLIPSSPAQATADVRAFRADGTELFAGSVVSQGTLADGVCSFVDDSVTVTTVPGTSSAAAVHLSVDDQCRLVVETLTDEVPAALLVAGRERRPKIPNYEPGTPVQGQRLVVPDVEVDVSEGAELVHTAADVAADAARSEVKNLFAAIGIYADGTLAYEYLDYTEMRYVVNHRKRTLGSLVLRDGICEEPPANELVTVPGTPTAPRPCYFNRTHNGPTIGYVTGGVYRKNVGVVPVDERELKVTQRLTYPESGPFSCDFGGPLKPGWDPYCTVWSLNS